MRSHTSVWCWGINGSGQLGDGTSIISRAVPGPVIDPDEPTANRTGVVRVALGGQYACALRGDGSVLCWGANGDGRLGDGTLMIAAVPTPVDVDAHAVDLASRCRTAAWDRHG